MKAFAENVLSLSLLTLIPSAGFSQSPGRSGVIAKVIATTITQNEDGSITARTSRVKDIGSYFAAMGKQVSIAKDDNLPPVAVKPDDDDDGGSGGIIGGGTGGKGAGGGGSSNPPPPPPPADVQASAADQKPPGSVTDATASSYLQTIYFADGWIVDETWSRTMGPPVGGWVVVGLNWHQPK